MCLSNFFLNMYVCEMHYHETLELYSELYFSHGQKMLHFHVLIILVGIVKEYEIDDVFSTILSHFYFHSYFYKSAERS